ncbi:retinoblastoma-like protein 1 isoform X2 [Ochlerotatus camptorhynchus]|uniref:retinoblastoma-like protein 1 isoform X2 n=1 Tax=Ochlerotatus camptorhynchus TaxID=644619 RepID=UPI0031D4425B
MTNMSEGEKLRADHRDICGQLNIDAATEEKSWNSFQEVRRTYNLDGDPLHWQCCALYITCRTTVTPTVGNTNSVLQGNCVSMTRLLRLSKINLNEFFKKINNWVGMTSQPDECRNAISNLQHNFIVSMSIYQKYREVFSTIFLAPSEDEQKRGKKSKPQPCSPNRLFKFCWKLFICAKAEYPEQNGDLVTSYNMLLCCLDLVYANAITDGRTDLVNPSFPGLPENFLTGGEIPPEPVCIIEELKEENSSSVIMTTRSTSWQNAINGFFRTGVLRGNAETFMELITVPNFEDNLKALDSLYNTFILSCGEFDEGIALEQKTPDGGFSASIKSELSMSASGTPERIQLCQQTPLNGRSRNAANDGSKFTPISTANASVTMLRLRLSGYTGEPQGSLKELFKTCAVDPSNIVRVRLGAMRDKFSSYMREQKWSNRAIAVRFDMTEALYYRLLENIIRAEQRRRQINLVRELCCEDMFNQTLLVCSAEIVNYAHNLQQNFPCILNVFEMAPFIFYRIIEVVVLHHNDLLSGEIIKHLTIIENQCIESLAWASSSPLWRAMENINYKVPTAQEVESSTDLSGITPHKPGESVTKINGQLMLESTPSTSMATPSGSSGPGNGRKIPNPDSAKKRLFRMDDDEPAKPDTSEGKDATATEAAEGPKEKKEPPKDLVAPRVNQPFPTTLGFFSPLKLPVPNGSLSKRRPGAASLNLFFRKYYSTAALRMNHLCTHLNLLSADIIKQIWTIFEYSIVNCTKELMRDRHLDQMVMCSIYLFARIKKINHKFAEIMKVYRTLPQSYSHVYRSVFISRLTADQQQQQQQQQQSQYGHGNREGGEDTRRVQPGDMAGVSVQHGGEERGDIIQFYNTVYIKVMQNIAIQFGNEDERSLILSPIPRATNRSVLLSPKQVDGRISLYVTPMDKTNDLKESPNARTFHFDRSPAKDLQEINRIVSSAPVNSCKRSLSNPDSYQQRTMKTKKWDRLISDRQQQENNGNAK